MKDCVLEVPETLWEERYWGTLGHGAVLPQYGLDSSHPQRNPLGMPWDIKFLKCPKPESIRKENKLL